MENSGQIFFKKTSYYSKEGFEPGAIEEPMVENPKSEHDPILLEKPNLDDNLSKLIIARRSKRTFSETPMTGQQLSQILYLTQGVTGEVGVAKLRSVASAGNRHPFNNYVMVNNVSGLKKGLYFYDHLKEALIPLRLGDVTKELQDACLGQKMIANCQICFIQTAVTARTTSRYHERGYRYIFIDVGHIGAQTQLICENLKLGSCNVGAYFDDKVAEFLNLKSDFEIPAYITVIGEPAS